MEISNLYLKKEKMFIRIFKALDLVLTVLLSLFCIIFFLVPSLKETPVRVLLGLSLVFFLPGYSLMATLFPRRNDLDLIERVALSFGLSIAVVPLLSLILNYTQFGIRSIPVLIVISIFAISLSLIAWIIRMKLPTNQKFTVKFDSLFKVKSLIVDQKRIDKILSFILIISIIASATIFFYVAFMPKTGERFTEFYILGPNGIASDYPTDLNIGEEGKVIIGIMNNEYENITYCLEVNFNGSLIHEENIFLIENEKWERAFTFKATKKGKNQKLEFLIYRDQQREAYRTLHIWINIGVVEI